MDVNEQRHLEVTRTKLHQLEELYRAARQKPVDDPHVRELSLRSLKRLINQLKEELVRFGADAQVRSTK